MHFLQKLPSSLRRHKFIEFLFGIGLLQNPIQATFNETATAFFDLSDPEPRNVFLKRVFDPDFFSVAQVMLTRNGTFFDLGANVGLCSFGLTPTHSGTHYHLFEANPNLITLLEKSAGLHPETDFHINHNCVTDQPGEIRFCLEHEQSGQSHVATEEEWGETVPNLLLDEYVEKHAIKQIDFAKIDLEGHELPALKGWQSCLSEHKVKAIYIEIMPENQARYGYETNSSLLLLESFGYKLFLCKTEDFENFANKVETLTFPGGTISVCSFRAKDYPQSFATDILAIAAK